MAPGPTSHMHEDLGMAPWPFSMPMQAPAIGQSERSALRASRESMSGNASLPMYPFVW